MELTAPIIDGPVDASAPDEETGVTSIEEAPIEEEAPAFLSSLAAELFLWLFCLGPLEESAEPELLVVPCLLLEEPLLCFPCLSEEDWEDWEVLPLAAETAEEVEEAEETRFSLAEREELLRVDSPEAVAAPEALLLPDPLELPAALALRLSFSSFFSLSLSFFLAALDPEVFLVSFCFKPRIILGGGLVCVGLWGGRERGVQGQWACPPF